MTTFIKVDGTDIDIKTALQWQLIGGDTSFTDATISNAAIVQYAAENGLSVAPEELQTFLNEIRYDLELDKADDMNQWLKEHGLELATVQNFCEIGVLRNKIRASIADDDIAAFFNNNKENYETAELYSLTVESEDMANELRTQIEDDGENFLALANEHSIDGDTFRQGGFIGDVTRGTVRAEVEAAVFAASSGELVGPVKDEDGYTLYMVSKLNKPELDDLKDIIRDDMFEETLEIISARATVDQVVLGIKEEPIDEVEPEEG